MVPAGGARARGEAPPPLGFPQEGRDRLPPPAPGHRGSLRSRPGSGIASPVPAAEGQGRDGAAASRRWINPGARAAGKGMARGTLTAEGMRVRPCVSRPGSHAPRGDSLTPYVRIMY